MSQIKFFFFGPPRVERAGEVFEIRLNKGKALLAYLLVGAKPYGQDALAAMFLPESDASRGRANLRRTLYRVMQQVGDEVLITTGPDPD